MKLRIIFAILCCVCAALPVVAQAPAPEDMVLIPAGEFWMGRTQGTWRDALDQHPRARMDDRPANLIYLDAFYLDKYEVTNAGYARFLEATGTRAPWDWPDGKIPKGEERQAVSNVNWFEATAYCKWAGKRLPTEAEWEKAERGGLDRKLYSWGNEEIGGGSYGGRGSSSSSAQGPAVLGGRDRAAAVGTVKPNGYGLYDMVGNVNEWTNDWYDANYYPFMPKKNPQGPETGLYRTLRGGGWQDGGGERVANYFRNFSDPELRAEVIGFRCAK